MTHTEILGFIRIQLQEEGVSWKSEKELFELLVPNESWDKYKTNWDNWKHKRVHNLNRSPGILTAIQTTLKLPVTFWDLRTDIEQKRVLQEQIQKFASPGKSIDLSSLMPPVHPVTDDQKQLIQEVIDIHRNDELALLEQYHGYFEDTFENQSFLLTLIPVLYDMAHYNFLDEKVFPALLPHNRANTQIKILMAHTLGSLDDPRYLEAAKLLDIIPHEEEAQLIDMKTAAISNVRRYELTKADLSKEDLQDILKIFIHYYHDTFTSNGTNHYYPGINLAYVLHQYDFIFQDIEHSCPLSLEEIYQMSKKSIQKDTQHPDPEFRYYAEMSKLEFKLLLDHDNIEPELYLLLEETQPSYATVERTVRQMGFFMKLTKKFITIENKSLQNFKLSTKILLGYIQNYLH